MSWWPQWVSTWPQNARTVPVVRAAPQAIQLLLAQELLAEARCTSCSSLTQKPHCSIASQVSTLAVCAVSMCHLLHTFGIQQSFYYEYV